MTPPTNEPFSIVLVEDNPADVVLVREALEVHEVSCKLQSYGTGESALLALARALNGDKSPLPDLVLLDWNLPVMGGAEVLRTIREWSDFTSIPIAVLTSSGSPRDRSQALTLGATRYIQKPMNLDDFVQQVGTHIRELLNSV
jgi:CheY-like chemotaxis protein